MEEGWKYEACQQPPNSTNGKYLRELANGTKLVIGRPVADRRLRVAGIASSRRVPTEGGAKAEDTASRRGTSAKEG